MDEHGLTGWTLTFGEARKRLGACRFRHHVIWISRTHALEGSEEQLLDTVLHEIEGNSTAHRGNTKGRRPMRAKRAKAR